MLFFTKSFPLLSTCSLARTARVSKKPAVERRASERHLRLGRQTCRLLAKPSFQCHHAVVRDLSLGGIGLLVPCPFPPGTRLALHLKSARPDLARTLTARVVHTS